MIMPHVLIVITQMAYGGFVVSMQEFYSKELCESARSFVVNKIKSGDTAACLVK